MGDRLGIRVAVDILVNLSVRFDARAKVTDGPQSSVSEYLELASLQNTQTEGPRGFSDVIGVSKERTEKFVEFFSQVSRSHRSLTLPMLPC